MKKAAVDPAIYGKLLAKTQAQTIRSEDNYDRMIEKIGALMGRGEGDLSPEETSLLEMISTLIERYEQERYSLKPSKPNEGYCRR